MSALAFVPAFASAPVSVHAPVAVTAGGTQARAPPKSALAAPVAVVLACGTLAAMAGPQHSRARAQQRRRAQVARLAEPSATGKVTGACGRCSGCTCGSAGKKSGAAAEQAIEGSDSKQQQPQKQPQPVMDPLPPAESDWSQAGLVMPRD
mmetsp:Transcript_44449/g.105329  ORF Transcript_44449/g.105329 Transcript_44449/m.105329 type:complete len:150 (-) Transcript_44449:215-664(-)